MEPNLACQGSRGILREGIQRRVKTLAAYDQMNMTWIRNNSCLTQKGKGKEGGERCVAWILCLLNGLPSFAEMVGGVGGRWIMLIAEYTV